MAGVMPSLHQRRDHPEYVPGCWACKISTLQTALPPAPGAAPARQRAYRYQESFAAEFHNGDREAYRRLRADGLQPPSIAGSAHLERHAQTRFEVEAGQVAPEGARRQLTEALALAADAGVDPLKAVTEPA